MSATSPLLQEVLAQRHAEEPLPIALQPPSSHEAQAGLPFAGFLQPFLRIGAARLRAGLAELRARLALDTAPWSAAVEEALLGDLARKLQAIATRTLLLELHVARLRGQLPGETPQQRFHFFSTSWLRNTRVLLAILREYPVLARLLATATERWLVVSLEFLERVAVERRLLAQRFLAGSELGVLEELHSGLSDPHRAGRGVLRLRFGSGLRLMYKPRSLAVDVRFQQLLQWLNARGLRHPHRVLTVVDRGSHGWVEHVRAEGCETQDALQRFYWRQGSALALLHLLSAIDFHLENLIAAGEFPLLVDLEALFHQRQLLALGETAQERAQGVLARSVSSVGLLPRLLFGQGGRAGVDVSGLGGAPGQLSPMAVPVLENQNQDTMRVTRRQGRLPGANNRPLLQGQPVDPSAFTEELVQGFEDTWGLLVRHRDALVPRLRAFADVEVRHLVRNTQRYVLLLSESFHPDYLRDEVEHAQALDHLQVEVAHWPALRQLVPFEQADLQQGDIPLFTARPGRRHLWSSSGECIPDYFERSSLEDVLERLASWDARECASQVNLIRQAMASLSPSDLPASVATRRQPEPSASTITPEECLAAATAIGEDLAAKAIHGRTDVCWLGVQVQDFNTWRVGIAPLGPGLYEGLGGLALFFAWLGALTGRRDFEALGRAALEPVLRAWRTPSPQLPGLGAFPGRTSAAYVLGHLGALWKEPALLDEVLAGLPTLEPLIETDADADLVSGVAGCALVLLGLHRQTGDARLLALARRCGDRLLATAVPGAEGGVGWKPPVWDRPLTGFAHGTAGISWALLELATATGDARYADLARRALADERSHFVPERGNWRDVRSIQGVPKGAPGGFMVAWCHGAPGIALGRLLSLRHLDDGRMRAELATALETTRREGFSGGHSLCHGAVGNLEVLHLAGKVLGEPRWTRLALEQAAQALRQGRASGWRCGLPGLGETPGLMMGLAGMGLGLLRLAAPDRVPSVLALESAARG
jgi:type 2 lantibiotic biosynthesis protein LanM